MGSYREFPVSPIVVSGTVRVIDPMLVVASAAFAHWACYDCLAGLLRVYGVAVVASVLIQTQLFQFAKVYRFESLSCLGSQFRRIFVAWTAVFLALFALAYVVDASTLYSRNWTILWYLFGLGAFATVRILLFTLIRSWISGGQLTRNLVIVGASEHGARLVQYLDGQRRNDIRILGIFDDRKSRVPRRMQDYPVVGSTDDLQRFVRENRVDQVIVALPWSAESRLMEIMRKLRTLPVDVQLSPDLIGFRLFNSSFDRLGSVPVVNVFRKPLSDWKLLAKILEDYVLGIVILLIVSPLMLLIALLIKLDSPGPVLFRQKRYGFNNHEIEVYKFRTMYQGAERDPQLPQARRNDPRVTRIGRFLRRSSLDELPQIFNVLRGDMSVVGPRPHAVPHNEYYAGIVSAYASRHRVKPGITGWAQVNGWRGETDTVEKMKKRVDHDIHYIDHWSVGLDLWILVMTVFVILRGDNAY